ncbi:hypothetical protein VTK56DRAFT_3905 [Thermocarpiscus australiensis]
MLRSRSSKTPTSTSASTTEIPTTRVTGATGTTNLLLFLLLLIALFPSVFHLLTTLPFRLLSSSKPSAVYRSEGAHTMWLQKEFTLPSRSRGAYLITDTVLKELPEIKELRVGLLNLFIKHTSCALSLNENWDEDVRADLSDALDRIVPEAGPNGEALYRHDAEGPDDLPAHVKSALIGASVTIPIKDGKLCTGTWQGIWYLEFRAMKHSRKVVATVQGEKA